jgi:molybdopterin/thiamine biosynthesis adenylyltransferase
MSDMPGSHIVLTGAGAVGSALAPHLARVPEVGRITIVDPDRFSIENLSAQQIDRADVGKCKAQAVAARVRSIRRDLAVDALVSRVEHVPAARLQADIHICCCDNRPARATCNEVSFRRGTPVLIDAGVRREHLMARASIYFPGTPGAACHLCGWGPADWEAYAASYTCQGTVGAPASGSPSHLCAMAASMVARLCCLYLSGGARPQADARQLVYSAELHRAWETTVRRSPECRFDHGQWIVSRMQVNLGRYTLGQALDELGGPIAVPGMAFARRLRCGSCGQSRDVLALAPRMSGGQRRCPGCGGETVAGPLDLLHELDTSAAQWFGTGGRERSLAELGLVRGDILRCRRGFIELGGRSTRKGRST